MSVASKLTRSVRQAKETVANEQDATPDTPSPQASTPAAKPAPKTTRPRANRKPEPEAPVVPFPSHRVWPD